MDPREIKYSQAISEAEVQAMERDPRVFIFGVGVADPTGIFNTTLEPRKRFGTGRVIDTPMSENTMTGLGVGAAMCGMRPILVHARVDFLLLTMDQIVNHAAKWRYMAGGKLSVPFVIRAIVGRGWGQAGQHSQSLQALFMHIPGLQVALPVSPYDAKGLLISAIESDMTTIFIEHRWLHEKSGPVPEEYYRIPFGKGAILREGTDVTLVAVSHMVLEARAAAEECAKEGIHVEVIDPRTIRPLDEELILNSVKKTGRLVVADTGWKVCGVSAEVGALVAEKAFRYLKAPIARVALPDVPTPCSPALENAFYPTAKTLVDSIKGLLEKEKSVGDDHSGPIAIRPAKEKEFSGPF